MAPFLFDNATKFVFLLSVLIYVKPCRSPTNIGCFVKKIFLICLFSVAACGHQVSGWDKRGLTESGFNKDRYTCTKEAANAAPASAGQITTGGYNLYTGSMQSYAVDVNQETRNTLFVNCMAAKGYKWVTKYYDKDGKEVRR